MYIKERLVLVWWRKKERKNEEWRMDKRDYWMIFIFLVGQVKNFWWWFDWLWWKIIMSIGFFLFVSFGMDLCNFKGRCRNLQNRKKKKLNSQVCVYGCNYVIIQSNCLLIMHQVVLHNILHNTPHNALVILRLLLYRSI